MISTSIIMNLLIFMYFNRCVIIMRFRWPHIWSVGACLGPLFFFMHLIMRKQEKIQTSWVLSQWKSLLGILIGIALNLQVNLERTDIFKIARLFIYECGVHLCLFKSPLMSFNEVLLSLAQVLLDLFQDIAYFHCEYKSYPF